MRRIYGEKHYIMCNTEHSAPRILLYDVLIHNESQRPRMLNERDDTRRAHVFCGWRI